MKKRIYGLLAMILAISLMSSMPVMALEAQPQAQEDAGAAAGIADNGDSSGESAGESSGDSGDLSEEDAQELLNIIMQAAEESAGTEAEGGLYGKPWVTAMDAGNLPEEAPAAVDDLILHYTYDIVKEHQDGSEYNGLAATSGELKDFMLAYLQDEANDSHDMQQLRLFFDQASDFAALKEAGISELQPYLEMLEGAQSIEELNAVLTSGDFPFDPWISLSVGSMGQDREETNRVFIYPGFLFVDLMQEEMLVDSDDPMVNTMRQAFIMQKSLYVTDVLSVLGIPEENISALSIQMLDLEKSYGKYCNTYDVKYDEYGVYAESLATYTMEELEQVSQNFPLCGILARYGMDRASGYAIQTPEWLEAFNGLWTEENLDLLKQMTKAKILMECRNFLDPDLFKVARTALHVDDPEPRDAAYKACDSSNTFAQVLAKTYAENCLGQEAVDQLTEMAQGLIETYKTLLDSTAWLGEESQQKVLDKLNNMRLNILYPDGGYFSYDDLELVPTEEGGTLIGNYLKLKEYNNQCMNELIDQKARCIVSWLVFPPTMANAFYAEFDNSINIIPGICTSGVYANDMTDSAMLGRIGSCVGHEISHAFDFRGSQMDHYGRPGSIFTDEDVETFLKTCDNLAAYYDTIEYMPGQFVNGKRVNVEAAADLSGMQVILAYAKTLPEYDLTELFEGACNDFVQVGPVGTSYTYVVADSHPLGCLRVNINAQMFDDFYDTYGCKEGDGMYLAPESRIRFWGE